MDILTELFGNMLTNTLANENKVNTEEYDLSNEKDYNEFIKAVKELKNDELFGILFGSLADKVINIAYEKYGKNFEKQKNENKKVEPVSKIERKEVDHSEEESNTEIDRPSNHVSVQQGLQIHKLVTEYVDTMIRPYSKGLVNDNVINDAYAGLYEFACWILNK